MITREALASWCFLKKDTKPVKPTKIDCQSLLPHFLHIGIDRIRKTVSSNTVHHQHCGWQLIHHVDDTVSLACWWSSLLTMSEDAMNPLLLKHSGQRCPPLELVVKQWLKSVFVGHELLVMIQGASDVICEMVSVDKLIKWQNLTKSEESWWKRILWALVIDNWQSEPNCQHTKFCEPLMETPQEENQLNCESQCGQPVWWIMHVITQMETSTVLWDALHVSRHTQRTNRKLARHHHMSHIGFSHSHPRLWQMAPSTSITDPESGLTNARRTKKSWCQGRSCSSVLSLNQNAMKRKTMRHCPSLANCPILSSLCLANAGLLGDKQRWKQWHPQSTSITSKGQKWNQSWNSGWRRTQRTNGRSNHLQCGNERLLAIQLTLGCHHQRCLLGRTFPMSPKKDQPRVGAKTIKRINWCKEWRLNQTTHLNSQMSHASELQWHGGLHWTTRIMGLCMEVWGDPTVSPHQERRRQKQRHQMTEKSVITRMGHVAPILPQWLSTHQRTTSWMNC